jgi:hypothetical protein
VTDWMASLRRFRMCSSERLSVVLVVFASRLEVGRLEDKVAEDEVVGVNDSHSEVRLQIDSFPSVDMVAEETARLMDLSSRNESIIDE